MPVLTECERRIQCFENSGLCSESESGNGFFQYPDLPQPVKNIGIDMKIENPDGITDHTVVDISKGHIEFGNDPFDFRILFKNPVTVQYLDAR